MDQRHAGCGIEKLMRLAETAGSRQRMEVSERGTRACVLDPANRRNEAVRKGEPLVARSGLAQGWACQVVEMPLSTYRTLFFALASGRGSFGRTDLGTVHAHCLAGALWRRAVSRLAGLEALVTCCMMLLHRPLPHGQDLLNLVSCTYHICQLVSCLVSRHQSMWCCGVDRDVKRP